MKRIVFLSLASLIMFSSCDKCYLCTDASGYPKQEICERGGKKITQSIDEAEAAGWVCEEITE